MRDFFGIALNYIDSVLDGVRPANVFEIAACRRQRDDLARDDFPWVFDVERGNRVCAFIEKLPHIKGKWGGKKIALEPWQIFIVTTVFGWVDSQGRRRFKTAYLEVPRKNAKSTLTSGVGLYLAFADSEPGAEVYSAATTRDQARIVWQDAKRMAEKTPGLRSRFGVQILANAISAQTSDSVFKPLSRDMGGNLDGLNVHGGLIDELHGHKTRDVFDVIETGMGAREQPLLWLITTAGSNRAGICYEQRTYLKKILNGVQLDDSYFGIIYTIDDDDDWQDELVWAKANPNLGVSVNIDDLRRLALKASSMASAQNNFKTKRLNIWVNADVSWMDMNSWNNCGDRDLRIEDFAWAPCYIGLDMASKIDIVSKAYVFDAGDKLVCFVKNYLPEEAIENSQNSQYSGWEELGLITTTPGAMADYDLIQADIEEDLTQFDVREIGYDAWQANQLASKLMQRGAPMVEVPMTTKNLSCAMKEIEARVKNQTIQHNACPVMEWMISNVVCHTDARENVYPRKESPDNKIDGPVALMMAMNRAMVAQPQGQYVYEY